MPFSFLSEEEYAITSAPACISPAVVPKVPVPEVVTESDLPTITTLPELLYRLAVFSVVAPVL